MFGPNITSCKCSFAEIQCTCQYLGTEPFVGLFRQHTTRILMTRKVFTSALPRTYNYDWLQSVYPVSTFTIEKYGWKSNFYDVDKTLRAPMNTNAKFSKISAVQKAVETVSITTAE